MKKQPAKETELADIEKLLDHGIAVYVDAEPDPWGKGAIGFTKRGLAYCAAPKGQALRCRSVSVPESIALCCELEKRKVTDPEVEYTWNEDARLRWFELIRKGVNTNESLADVKFDFVNLTIPVTLERNGFTLSCLIDGALRHGCSLSEVLKLFLAEGDIADRLCSWANRESEKKK